MTDPFDPGVHWCDGGVPVSGRFGDVYFSAENGLAETHHVFLDGIGAPGVWAGRRQFVVGELGFGTGLNFLATWRHWRETAAADARLHYVAIEGFPMAVADAVRALAAYPELADLASTLNERRPTGRGFHQILFDGGRVTLLLIHDDVRPALTDLHAQADAWFLDGFAPARNPEMWTPDVLKLVAARSRPGARLATFTVAGAVRRGLADAGFTVEKRPGFGAKRECLGGRFNGNPAFPALPAWSRLPQNPEPSIRVAVVGAGIAGTSAAAALAATGANVALFDAADAPGAGASGTPAGIVQPRPLADDTPAAHFFTAAFHQAARTYDALPAAWAARGVLVLGRDDADRDRYAALAEAQYLDVVAASDAAGLALPVDGVWFADGGVLDTRSACAALATGVQTHFGCAVTHLEPGSGGWRLTDEAGATHEANAVVLAGGLETTGLAGFPDLGLRANRGQVSLVPASRETCGLKAALTIGGYLTPAVCAAPGTHTLGATFDRIADGPDTDWRAVSDAGHDRNWAILAARLPDWAGLLSRPTGAWTGLRATTPDRLPVVGPVPNREAFVRDYADHHHRRDPADGPAPVYRPGVYVLAGLGSRGFLTAPLASAVLAAQIMDTPLPVAAAAVPLLHPARFLIRALRKGLAG